MIWQTPESAVGMLPVDMSGLDTIELGCGTAYVSAWMLFHETGFEVLDYLELQAPAGTNGPRHYTTAEWARAYPSEHVWKLRNRGVV